MRCCGDARAGKSRRRAAPTTARREKQPRRAPQSPNSTMTCRPVGRLPPPGRPKPHNAFFIFQAFWGIPEAGLRRGEEGVPRRGDRETHIIRRTTGSWGGWSMGFGLAKALYPALYPQTRVDFAWKEGRTVKKREAKSLLGRGFLGVVLLLPLFFSSLWHSVWELRLFGNGYCSTWAHPLFRAPRETSVYT